MIIAHIREFLMGKKKRQELQELRRLKEKMKPTDDFESFIVDCRVKEPDRLIYLASNDHMIFAIINLLDQAVEDRLPVRIYGKIPFEVRNGIFSAIERVKNEALDIDVAFDEYSYLIGFVVIGINSWYLLTDNGNKATVSFNGPDIGEALAKDFPELKKSIRIRE